MPSAKRTAPARRRLLPRARMLYETLQSPPAEVEDRIADAFDDVRERARRRGAPLVLSITRPAATRTALAARCDTAVAGSYTTYWRDADGESAFFAEEPVTTIAARGGARFDTLARDAADLLDGAVALSVRGAPALPPRLVGGFSFGPSAPTDVTWRGFDAAEFALHGRLLHQVGGELFEQRNLLVQPTAAPLDNAGVASLLREPNRAADSTPPTAQDAPGEHVAATRRAGDGEAFLRAVQGALAAIEAGELEKVVLARRIELTLRRRPALSRIVRRLAAAYPGCTTFAYGGRAGPAFVGATPERLLAVDGDIVRTVALAGTAVVSDGGSAVREASDALLSSDKDRREHESVVSGIAQALDGLVEGAKRPDTPATVRFGDLLHLATPIRAVLRPGTGVFDVIAALHPTPAVGGRPRPAALRFIREHEPAERGWYSGGVGWLDASGRARFSVALRSAIIDDDRALLFAGAGIVHGSDAARELAETEAKLRPVLDALGIAP